MELNEIAGLLSAGRIVFVDKEVDAATLEWNEHPTFKGVYLKHLILGADTGGLVSCHMVKVDAGCELACHAHPEQGELHEVICGTGDCTINDSMCSYYPGRMIVIPQGVPHRVVAGDDGLVLLAKFFPALQ